MHHGVDQLLLQLGAEPGGHGVGRVRHQAGQLGGVHTLQDLHLRRRYLRVPAPAAAPATAASAHVTTAAYDMHCESHVQMVLAENQNCA